MTDDDERHLSSILASYSLKIFVQCLRHRVLFLLCQMDKAAVVIILYYWRFKDSLVSHYLELQCSCKGEEGAVRRAIFTSGPSK